MPRVIDAQTDETIGLDDLVEMLSVGGFDPDDEDNFASWGLALKKLANNRTFLADIALAELKDRCGNQTRENQYGPQVIMLGGAGQFFLRANFWPGKDDPVLRASGTAPFFYGVPHDHNFSFLTVGYLGPGYWSEYYEFDYDEVVGHTGEKVNLRYIEKSRLEPGKVMLYRAHRDVHNQLAADSMSVSVNIMGMTHGIPLLDQYKFDIANKRVDSMANRIATEPLLALSAHFGGGNGADLLANFAAGHPSDRVRFLALQAQAAVIGDVDARIAHYEQAARSDSRFVREMARLEIEKLERGRSWLAGQALEAA
jgi:hypothetical protein